MVNSISLGITRDSSWHGIFVGSWPTHHHYEWVSSFCVYINPFSLKFSPYSWGRKKKQPLWLEKKQTFWPWHVGNRPLQQQNVVDHGGPFFSSGGHPLGVLLGWLPNVQALLPHPLMAPIGRPYPWPSQFQAPFVLRRPGLMVFREHGLPTMASPNRPHTIQFLGNAILHCVCNLKLAEFLPIHSKTVHESTLSLTRAADNFTYTHFFVDRGRTFG